MNAPICDFVRKYIEDDNLRLHMPGHKGTGILGVEALDITEFDGADSLYEANGIIAESETNAGKLFGCHSFYSTEGSSQCIRAMLYLVLMRAKDTGRAAKILAGRNAHKAMISAAALLDFEIDWLYSEGDSYLSCQVDPDALKQTLSQLQTLPAAVYITSPDYLGRCCDICKIADVCHLFGVPLVVDNAHGAYSKFLPESLHPVDLGADMCCDSAHKTLPALTGSAYLHITDGLMEPYSHYAKSALALFGSTSPSYLILQSLDALNVYLCSYPERLESFLKDVSVLKRHLTEHGYTLYGDEPLKLTIAAKFYGYTGSGLAAQLKAQGIICEFSDPDYLVLMLSPELGTEGLSRIEEALIRLQKREVIGNSSPPFFRAEQVLTVREALLAPCEEIPVRQSAERVLANSNFSCPPAVPILVSGERIDQRAIECFLYYGIENCRVVIE